LKSQRYIQRDQSKRYSNIYIQNPGERSDLEVKVCKSLLSHNTTCKDMGDDENTYTDHILMTEGSPRT